MKLHYLLHILISLTLATFALGVAPDASACEHLSQTETVQKQYNISPVHTMASAHEHDRNAHHNATEISKNCCGADCQCPSQACHATTAIIADVRLTAIQSTVEQRILLTSPNRKSL